ncbi:MAG: type I secretion C-terminal target domain-containing protein, partial [Akkermansiaceae bacterium]|nr:type I secretion C-terminal target domain-containing protein [Akkermansiaceae bacterium]
SQAISYAGAPGYQMDGEAVRGYRNHSGDTMTSIFRRDGALLQNIYGMSYDGENVAPTTVDPVLPTIGARRAAIAAGENPIDEGFDGQINELLVFPSALPEQKLRDVHDYLNSKWGDAVIWDLSTELKSVVLSGGSSSEPQIIRGGHGDDVLGGGSADDTISGGPGADVLSGGAGTDRFVFGGIDTGADTILDFDVSLDVVDLSALFWGQSGDARDFLSIRLDTDFSTEVPTLNSVLLVQRSEGDVQEITLKNVVIGPNELVQMVVEGRIDMGGLSIPSEVQLSLASGVQGNSFDEPFTVVLTRNGDGSAGAIDIPIGFFEESLGGRFVIDEATANEKKRSVVHFARDETEKALTVRPVPDLETTGTSELEVAVLPHHKYTVSGSSVNRVINDQYNVWLEVLQSNAVADLGQPARVRVYRDGDAVEALTVPLELSGTAESGVHVESVGNSLTIPIGQSYAELLVTARADGLSEGAKVMVLRLASDESYQLGNPSEALLYVGATAEEANSAGFDRWLSESTSGAMTSLADLAGKPQEEVNRFVQAYAYGEGSVEAFSSPQISFQIVDGKPEILANSVLRFADVRWGVESGDKLGAWLNQSAKFVGTDDVTGTKFVGEALTPEERAGFYRLTMSMEAGVYTNGNIAALAGTSDFGTSGSSSWNADQVSGDLTSSGGEAGEVSRIVAELPCEGDLNFDMEIVDGDGSLEFYIDGVKQAETDGDLVSVQQELSGTGSHLLMWQFTKGTGNAVIRNLGK